MDLNNLLTNKLFLQYLTAAGNDILSRKPIGTNVNAVTNQAITAQNFTNLMKKLLSNDNDMKASIDKNGMKLHIPTTSLGFGAGVGNGEAIGTANGTLGAGIGASNEPLGNVSSNKEGGLSKLLNPFSDSQLNGISAGDLAGLTPQMISNALALKRQNDSLNEQKFVDLAKLMPKPTPTVPTFIKNTPYGDITLDQYKALPTNTKEYLSYLLAARQLGEKPKSLEEYNKMKNKSKIPTTAMGAAIARYVAEHGEMPPDNLLAKWTKMYGTSPVTISLGEKVKTTQQSKVTDPGFPYIIAKRYNSDDFFFNHRNMVKAYAAKHNIDKIEATKILMDATIRKDMDKEIRQAFRGEKVTYVAGRGWYVNGKLTVRDY